MIQIDTGILSIIITVLLAIVGLAAGLGALSQKVRQHDDEIKTNRVENQQAHQRIFDKLEDINNFIRNGK